MPTVTFNINTTWTAPAGVFHVSLAECWGCGHDGGKNWNGGVYDSGGGGGGSGGYSSKANIPVTPGNSYTVHVDIDEVYFISAATVQANRGSQGGDATATGSGGAGAGGAGAAAGVGDVALAGNDGSAGQDGFGSGATGGDGGTAPGTGGGAGGAGGSISHNGGLASAPGGGGGGAGGDSGVTSGGGSGAVGLVRLTFTAGSLRRPAPLSGLGGGPFFTDPLGGMYLRLDGDPYRLLDGGPRRKGTRQLLDAMG